VGVATLSTVALGFALTAAPARAMPVSEGSGSVECLDPASIGTAARSGTGEREADHRDVSPRQQRAIERRTERILARSEISQSETRRPSASVPVYFHVMMDEAGNGNVSRHRIDRQMAVLNTTFGGLESAAASDTGFTFALAGVDRYYNDTWHRDGSSVRYRSRTRLGGADALNIWLVEFDYLGVATFPWDYASNPEIDGIRVNSGTLPKGSIARYNRGKTATHEVGHWFGLYHTFQGGCATPNDRVPDTPAQSSPTRGCPEGRNSCALPGLDPIHNYMDYSYDSCYNQFTADQSARMSKMWTAYRGPNGPNDLTPRTGEGQSTAAP